MRLEAAGIDPASVTDVVLNHIHMDHIGGLLVDGLRGRLRPDLRIHLAAAEAEFWGHTPGHSIVRLESGGDRLTFAGDAVFQPGFDGKQLVATHLPFPSVCHVAVAGNAFRFLPAVWDY